MHYFDIKSKKDLIDYVKDDFLNTTKRDNDLSPYGKQIRGKALPGAYVWGTFKSDKGYTCICFRKDSDEETVMSTGETHEEMFSRFVESVSELWKLPDE